MKELSIQGQCGEPSYAGFCTPKLFFSFFFPGGVRVEHFFQVGSVQKMVIAIGLAQGVAVGVGFFLEYI